MTTRIFAERKRSLIAAIQAARTIALSVAGVVFIVTLSNADPHHSYANAVFGAARQWLQAAFNI